MAKQDLLFLLLPSTFLLIVAGLALSSSGALSFSPRVEERRQQDFEKFIAKIQKGEVQPTKEQWLTVLRDSRKVERVIESGHVVLTRFLAGGILIGVVLQVYVVFRFKARYRKMAG